MLCHYKMEAEDPESIDEYFLMLFICRREDPTKTVEVELSGAMAVNAEVSNDLRKIGDIVLCVWSDDKTEKCFRVSQKTHCRTDRPRSGFFCIGLNKNHL